MTKAKRNFFTSAILAVFTWIGQACSPLGKPVNKELSDSYYYTKSGNGIVFSSMGNWFELGKIQIEEADPASFEVLATNLAKDKNRAYYRDVPIDYPVDLATFRVKSGHFMMDLTPIDQKNVYSFGKGGKVFVVEDADPETFQITDLDWAHDNQHHYYRFQKIDVDYASFEVVNKVFAKDEMRLYYFISDKGLTPVNADVTNLSVFNEEIVYDREFLYVYAWYTRREKVDVLHKIPYRDIAAVKVIDEVYLQVDNAIFSDGFAVPRSDATSFSAMDYFYGRDKTQAYYWGLVIQEADAATFEVLSGGYAKDSSTVFYLGKVVKGARAATFQRAKDWYYYEDGVNKYHEGKLLKDSDI